MRPDAARPPIHLVADPYGGLSESPDGSMPNFGLTCSVLCSADGSDSTLGGITSTVNQVVLTDPFHVREHLGIPCAEPLGVTAPSLDPTRPRYAPELQLRLRKGRLIACPPDARPDGSPYASGGNFVYTTDSRLPDHRPVPVHDRDLRRERDPSRGVPSAPKGPPRGLTLESRTLCDSAVGAQLAGGDMLAGGLLVRLYPVEGDETEFGWYAEGFHHGGRWRP